MRVLLFTLVILSTFAGSSLRASTSSSAELSNVLFQGKLPCMDFLRLLSTSYRGVIGDYELGVRVFSARRDLNGHEADLGAGLILLSLRDPRRERERLEFFMARRDVLTGAYEDLGGHQRLQTAEPFGLLRRQFLLQAERASIGRARHSKPIVLTPTKEQETSLKWEPWLLAFSTTSNGGHTQIPLHIRVYKDPLTRRVLILEQRRFPDFLSRLRGPRIMNSFRYGTVSGISPIQSINVDRWRYLSFTADFQPGDQVQGPDGARLQIFPVEP